jgi:hypothetical protein
VTWVWAGENTLAIEFTKGPYSQVAKVKEAYYSQNGLEATLSVTHESPRK